MYIYLFSYEKEAKSQAKFEACSVEAADTRVSEQKPDPDNSHFGNSAGD